MASVLVTGFPGFLGSELVERLLARCPADVLVDCLIQASYRELAERRIAGLERMDPRLRGRVRLYPGDITRPDLGLGDQYDVLRQDTVEIYHLAAVYDLGVRRDFAMQVNVMGTRHMLAFAEACRPNLSRFQYVSTCYVSGRYPGVFSESDLAKGQSFNNYYEETKYLAELDVQQHRAAGLPVTIYRPSIVVGDSETGATQKYDGIYYMLQWLLRQPSVAVLPVIGDPTRYEVNLVPRDFVVDALACLSSLPQSLGQVYQLCDPQPLYVDQIIDLLGSVTRRRIVRIPLPKAAAKGALTYVPLVRRIMKIEPATVDYFSHPTHYTCENTLRDLEGTGIGISCPPFYTYVDKLVQFMQQHPEISPQAMV